MTSDNHVTGPVTEAMERVLRVEAEYWASFRENRAPVIGPRDLRAVLDAAIVTMKSKEQASVHCPQSSEAVERDISGETVCGFRVAAWRETHPEHGDKYGHSYSEHWSTPSNRDPRVKVERLFTEDQLRAAISRTDDRLREALASIAETMPGRTHKEASAQRREIARTALKTPAKGEGE